MIRIILFFSFHDDDEITFKEL